MKVNLPLIMHVDVFPHVHIYISNSKTIQTTELIFGYVNAKWWINNCKKISNTFEMFDKNSKSMIVIKISDMASSSPQNTNKKKFPRSVNLGPLFRVWDLYYAFVCPLFLKKMNNC